MSQSMANKIIYKITNAGNVQQWQQEIEGNKYRTISGKKGGKLVISDWVVCEGTNIGRANERTPEEQAIFIVNSNYKKKLDKDYHTSLETIEEGAHIFEPMTAHEYNKALAKKKGVDHSEIFCQPKLDGMRCVVKKDGMWSRKGKPIVCAPHIFEALKPWFESFPDMVFDGELYNHDFKDDFNEIISIAKQVKPDEEDIQKSKDLLEYHMYDLYYPENQEFSKRMIRLQGMIDTKKYPFLKVVKTNVAHSPEELKAFYDEYLEAGYEGQMVRLNTPYENKRSWNLLKRKEFMDAEYILVNLQEGKGNWAGKAKIATLKTEDGREFGAGITGTMEFCEKLLKNKDKYIGKKTTVNFFALTPDGIPRFGRCKEFDRQDV